MSRRGKRRRPQLGQIEDLPEAATLEDHRATAPDLQTPAYWRRTWADELQAKVGR